MAAIGDGSEASPIWRTDFQIGNLLSHPLDGRETFVNTLLGLPEPPGAIVRRSHSLSIRCESRRAGISLPKCSEWLQAVSVRCWLRKLF